MQPRVFLIAFCEKLTEDRHDIRKVKFENLFENARLHGGDEIEIALTRHSHAIQLVFSDNGPGISKANAKRIFEPFFTTARKNGGTGLGLAIIATLMNAHQGSISLAPSDKGCRFELTFPSFERYPSSD